MEITARHHLVHHAVVEEVFGALEAFRQLLADRFLDDPGTRETDHGTRFSHGDVAQHRERGRHAAGRRIGEDDNERQARFSDLIRREHVATLFSESSVDPKLIRQIAAEAGARVDAGLYGDTLGPAGSGADTYLAMMRHNGALLAAGMAAGRKG